MQPEAVEQLRALGLATIRVHACGKAPIGEWKDRTNEPADFQPGDNVGVRLGDPSGGLVDIDLDTQAALPLAPLFLPPTATFGRASKPRSHWIYRCLGARTRKPPRAHVELRSTGTQTVFPPSVHESGEPIRWTDDTPIVTVDEAELLAGFGKLAAATLIAQAMPSLKGNVHDTVLALAGALWHAGWSLDDALALLLPAMELGGGPDNGHREAAIRDTWGEHGRNRHGWPTVMQLLGPLDGKAVQRAVELVATTPRALVEGGVLRDSNGAAAQIRPLTDAGNAERFVDEHGEDVRHVVGIGWHQWDGPRWAKLEGEPVELMIRSARLLQAQGKALNQPGMAKWGFASESAGKLRAGLGLARDLPAMRVSGDDLDADPWLFNCPNGTIDLRTGELRPHAREDLITKMAGVEYDPTAEAPRFVRFLGEVCDGDQEMVSYLLRSLGYSLTGLTTEQTFWIWFGPKGANGKSTLIDLLLFVLGDYAGVLAPDVLLQQRGSQHPTGLMDVWGRRFMVANELPEGRRVNEALIKSLTGSDRIKARAMRKDFVEFAPTHKLVLATNACPIVREQGRAFWRRVQLVPWLVSFEGREDRTLPSALRAEAAGVLRLLVWGCQEWQRIGLSPPDRVREAIEQYRTSQDTIGAFIGEVLEQEPDAAVDRSRVYDAYQRWAASQGEHVLSARALYRILAERGLDSSKTNGRRVLRGWRLQSANGSPDFGAKVIPIPPISRPGAGGAGRDH